MANGSAMTLLLDTRHPLQPLVHRAQSHGAAVMRALDADPHPASHMKRLSPDLVQAHGCFVDLLAADYQVEQIQALVDATKAVMDAMVTSDLSAFASACEGMRLAMIAWGDRNGWND